MAVAITAVVEPRVTLAGTAALAFLVVYVYRRHWLLVAIFIALSFQNLAYIRLMPINSQLAAAVKHADDIFAVFLAVALVAEMFFPAVRLNRFPQWQQFIGLLGVCVLSAAYNHVPLTSAATGVYMLIKCFVWFLLASSIKLDERGWRFLFRAWLIMLGVILAFAVFQFFTGELTYNLLGLKSDYRFGILRLRSIFLYPVYLAEAMGLLAAISIGAFLQWRKPAYLALGLAALAAVVLTMTAKAILSLGFAVGFLLLRKRARLIVPYAIVAVIAILTLPEYGLRNLERQFRVYVESPRSSRRESYRIAGEILRDSPVFGAGPGMFGGYAATLLESPTLDKYAFINYVGVE
ncbi:hypothetical protein FJY63_11645, partial [Candidatus Sumerlaeota bacterium]|nr:hypothetical protein [Candidatus Sumerlaeota bacterium]